MENTELEKILQKYKTRPGGVIPVDRPGNPLLPEIIAVVAHVEQLSRDVDYHRRLREYERGALADLALFIGFPNDTAKDTVERAMSMILRLRQERSSMLIVLQAVNDFLEVLNRDQGTK